jgi:hypothetical protein
MKPLPNYFPLPFLFLAILGLFSALWAGLMRLGWQLPALTPFLALSHGPLMISGFLGTLITLERAVAMQKKWMYIPPLLSGLGWLITVLMPSPPLGQILLSLASLGGVAILAEMTRREFALHTVTMLLGLLAWFTGNLLWLFGWQIFQVVFSLAGISRSHHCRRTIGVESRPASLKESTDCLWCDCRYLCGKCHCFNVQLAGGNTLERCSIAIPRIMVNPQ